MVGFFKISLLCLLVLGVSRRGLAQTLSPTRTMKSDDLDEDLNQAKAEVDQLKNDWDRTRLETTLYNKRAQRQYLRWVKASRKLKAKAQVRRDQAQLELLLSVEKRKLAYTQWQMAQLHEASEEIKIEALGLHQDTQAIQDKIQQMESKLNSSQTPTALSR